MPPERGEQTKVYRSHTVRILVPIALFSSLSRRGLGTQSLGLPVFMYAVVMFLYTVWD